jgi:hypothetical protein
MCPGMCGNAEKHSLERYKMIDDIRFSMEPLNQPPKTAKVGCSRKNTAGSNMS